MDRLFYVLRVAHFSTALGPASKYAEVGLAKEDIQISGLTVPKEIYEI